MTNLTNLNLSPGDVVIFGEDGDAATAKLIAIGYPMCSLDFGPGIGVIHCFTGGITRRATDDEVRKFRASNP